MVVNNVSADYLLLHRNRDDFSRDKESDWTTSQGARTNLRSLSRSRLGLVLAALCGFFLSYFLDRRNVLASAPSAANSVCNITAPHLYTQHIGTHVKTTVLKKPEGIRVIGFLFFGRRMLVNVL